MVMDEVVESMTSEIRRILTDFAENHNDESLTPQGATKVTEAIREALSASGIAGLRKYLQSHEESSETVKKDGKVYRYKFTSDKEFLTPFGLMKLPRRLYQPDQGGASLVPLDTAWGMEGEFATIEVREACLFGVGLNTPEEVEALLKKSALFHPSASTIKRLARETNEWLEEHKQEVDEALREEEKTPAEVESLVASLDGVNVLLAEPGKKRGRPTERPKKESEKDEDKTSYKNAMVGSVSYYTSEEDEEEREGQLKPVRLASGYVARMPEDRAPTVKREFEEELSHAESRLSPEVYKLLLFDGSRVLWNYVENNERYAGYEKAVEYYHTTEHLSSAAEALFGKKSEEATKWYEKYRVKLREEDGAAESVLRSMDYYSKRLKLSKSRQEALETERTFFRRNKHRMPYASLRARGLPIGNGVVDAACKSVVKQRLCRSGMRWSRTGGQAVLSLRTYIKSNRWELFWKQYNELKLAG